MPRLLITGTHGPSSPTRASLPFQIAKGAVEAGFEVQIVLAHDATLILKDAVRRSLLGIGMPPLTQLFQFAVDHQVRIFARGGCAKARGVSDEDLEGKPAEFIDRKRFAELIFESDKLLSF